MKTIIACCASLILMATNSFAQGDVTSTFESSAEGWSVVLVPDAMAFDMLDSHVLSDSSNGFICTEEVIGPTSYWKAPDKYIGNQLEFYGRWLKFDLQVISEDPDEVSQNDVVIQGVDSTGAMLFLAHDIAPIPGEEWTEYYINLSAQAGWRILEDGIQTVAPSRVQMESVLGSLEMLLIRAEYINGWPETMCLDNVALLLQTGVANEGREELPQTHVLSSLYPNPFNPQTNFTLEVALTQQVRVSAFDILGKEIKQIFEGLVVSGEQQVFAFEANRLPSGFYFIQIQGESFLETRKAILQK